MMQLTLNLLLQVAAIGASGHDYATAYRETAKSGRPLVVLIGADWCPGCQQMKTTALPELKKSGEQGKISFAYVNADHESDLAGKLMRGSSIPQLVLYQKTDTGWKRQQLTGAQSISDIRAFLGKATDASVANLMERE